MSRADFTDIPSHLQFLGSRVISTLHYLLHRSSPAAIWFRRCLGSLSCPDRQAIWLVCSFSVALLCSAFLATVQAQEPNPPNVSIPDDLPDAIANGIRPDLIYLRDENGKFILVPRTSYKEFEEFLQSETEGPLVQTESNESLDQLQLLITVDGNMARISVQAKVTLERPSKRWLTIPLGLGSIQVIPTTSQGTGKYTFPPIRVSSETPGYVWKLSPSNDLERQLTFQGVSNINSSAQGHTLRLDLPFVVTDIRMRLPAGSWDLSASGTGSEVVEPFRDAAPYSEAIVRSTGGPIALSWSKKMSEDQIQATEVESRTTYSLSSESNQLRAVSNLSIRGPKPLGGRQFLVHLSSESVWRDSSTGLIPFQGYRISKVETAEPTVLRIEFEESVSRTDADVNIEWIQNCELNSTEMEFAIPRIEGVEAHVGSLDISLPRNIQFQWEPQKGIEFIKQTNEGPDASVYGFRMQQQDQPLKALWATREESLQLKATYQVFHDRGQLLLTGRIDTINDMRSFSFLQFDVKEWNIDRLQVYPSGKIVEAKPRRNTIAEQGQLISIPLSVNDLEIGSTSATASGNSAEANPSSDAPIATDIARDSRSVPRGISFVLSKRLTSTTGDSESIQFVLPRLSWIDRNTDSRKTLTIPGEVAVQSWSSILSTEEGPSPFWSELFHVEGLMAISNTPKSDRTTEAPRSQKKYRVLSSDDWITWKGQATQAIVPVLVAANNEISIGGGWVELSQSWRMTAIGRIPNEFLLGVPKEWIATQKDPKDALDITVDGQSATISKASEIPTVQQWFVSPATLARYDWLRISIATSELSTTAPVPTKSLNLRKRWALTDSPDKLVEFDWPLPILNSANEKSPLNLESFDGEIRVDPKSVCHLKFPEKLDSETNARSTVYFDCTLTEPRLQGILMERPAKPQIDVVVESMWLQTMLNALEQRDRYVVQFTSTASYISLLLPVDQLDDCRVILNGQKPKYSINPSTLGRVDIELNSSDSIPIEPAEYVLEIFTWPKPRKEWIRSVRATPPRILNASQHYSMLWQVILPSTEHLVVTSSGLSPSYRWQWKDLWYERQSELTQEMLEKKFNATTQPIIAQQTNTYLLFALDQSSDMKIWTAPRYVLWVPVATLLLIGAFSILEFRWIQKPWLGIAILLLSFAFSQFAWDLSIALIQCLIASIGIAVVYIALKWILDRRSRRRSVFSSRSATSNIPVPVRDNQTESSIVRAPIISTASPTTPPIVPSGAERREGSSTTNIHSLSNAK